MGNPYLPEAMAISPRDRRYPQMRALEAVRQNVDPKYKRLQEAQSALAASLERLSREKATLASDKYVASGLEYTKTALEQFGIHFNRLIGPTLQGAAGGVGMGAFSLAIEVLLANPLPVGAAPLIVLGGFPALAMPIALASVTALTVAYFKARKNY